jgi:hypothetical protein
LTFKRKVTRMNPARAKFLKDCARVKEKLDEIGRRERGQSYRPMPLAAIVAAEERRPIALVRQTDLLDALLESWHDRIRVSQKQSKTRIN